MLDYNRIIIVNYFHKTVNFQSYWSLQHEKINVTHQTEILEDLIEIMDFSMIGDL